MSTFLSTVSHTICACHDVYRIPHKTDFDIVNQSISIFSTTLRLANTLPPSPLKNQAVIPLLVTLGALQFTPLKCHIERGMQITRIALVVHTAIFGNNRQRLAIALVVAIATLNHKGYVSEKWQYRYIRWNHFLDFGLILMTSKTPGEFYRHFSINLPLVMRHEKKKQEIIRLIYERAEQRAEGSRQVRRTALENLTRNCLSSDLAAPAHSFV
ncbi:MAG: hypothetical protein KDK50_03000 [Chlamydiia bacterium]|nr:hypothetical protein [Chlamydiia bacterium]